MDIGTTDRLKTCFLTVFPEINPNEIDTASSETVQKWDSLRAMSLVALIEEEFKIEFVLDDIMNFTSFGRIHDCALKMLQKSDGAPVR